MKKKTMRMFSIVLAAAVLFGSAANVWATVPESDISAPPAADEDGDTVPTAGSAGTGVDEDEPAKDPAQSPEETKPEGNGQDQTQAPSDSDSSANTGTSPETGGSAETGGDVKPETNPEPETEGGKEEKPEDVNGSITMDDKDVEGVITVDEDKNDDKVEIKKNDKPYLALGEDLSAEQRATVLAIMGIDASKLSDYDVVYINNSEEHQYLGSYIDSDKIGSRSLSSIVIVQREKGNGIQISTNNISYCTVGMYKNALATAGIQDADIIVAAPFAISGTAALVGVFKAYTQMTGDVIDEENIDAALHELVVTGNLEASGGDSDEIEGMIAYVKQAVVEHDLSDETEIREAIAKGCKKFNITLNDEEINEIVKVMQKISDLDLDLDKILNAAQSVYDKISHAEGGFWAKIRELFETLLAKIKELF